MRANPKNFDPRNYLQSIMDTVISGSIPNADVAKIVACMKDGVMEAIAPLLVQFGSYRKSELIQPVTLEQMADRYKKEGI
jgi:fructose-bisphosphate aldolase class II